MFEERPTPVVASAEAARKLPRVALLTLLVLFIIPGMVTREFWGSEELTTFAVALNMAQGSALDWVLPNIDGTPFYDAGPLTAWLAALCMKLFGWLIGLDAAARLSGLIGFAAATASIWYGTWYLARRNEAQPVALAFGGQASPKDFGRVVADAALLLFIATFGLFIPQRLLGVDTAILCAVACFFFSLSYTLRRPALGPIITGLVIGVSVWAADLALGVSFLAIALVIHARIHAFERPLFSRLSTVTLVSVGTFFLWPLLAVGFAIETVDAWFDGWWLQQFSFASGIRGATLSHIAHNVLWFLWPLWPFALLALYAFRKQLNRTHIKLPLFILVGLLLTQLAFAIDMDRYLVSLAAPMSVLAASGLLSARRSWSNMLDWFSATVFTLALAVLWAYSIAWHLGAPVKMAASIEMLAPGVTPTAHGLLFVLAFAVTLGWLMLVLWRMNRREVVAWKGPWLAATGITALAIITVYLFGPAIDKARSFQPVIAQAAMTVHHLKGQGTCVASETLSAAQRKVFTFYGLTVLDAQKATCTLRLERDASLQKAYGNKLNLKPLATFSRPRDHERFILLKD